MVSINSTLFNPTEKLKIQLSVGLNNNEYQNLINIFETKKGLYISINPNITIQIKYIKQKNEWDRTDTAYITERNIYNLKHGLKSFYEKIMNPKMFIYNSKGYVAELNTRLKMDDTIEVIPLTRGQFIQLEPAILYDKQGNPLPGVMLRLNKDSNEIDLSIDEYEAMMNLFRSVNIRLEGWMMLQTYLSLRKNPMEIDLNNKQSQSRNTVNYNRSIFDRTPPASANNSDQNEFVKFPQKSTTQEFMNIPIENLENEIIQKEE